MGLELTGRVTVVDGLRAGFYTTGSFGPPVVLLHGGGTDSAMLSWRETIPALSSEYRVFAPDWPGYGISENFASGYSFDQMVHWMDELFNHWELERTALVGISMGGGAALAYALQRPERVSKLALVDTYGVQRRFSGPVIHFLSYLLIHIPGLVGLTWAMTRGSRSMARAALGGIFADRNNISDALVDEVYHAMQHPDGQRAFSEFQRQEIRPFRLKTCYLERLAELRPPVLIVHGEKDSLVPLAGAREAARRIPGARLEVIPDAGHWPMREQPAVFNRILKEFLGD